MWNALAAIHPLPFCVQVEQLIAAVKLNVEMTSTVVLSTAKYYEEQGGKASVELLTAFAKRLKSFERKHKLYQENKKKFPNLCSVCLEPKDFQLTNTIDHARLFGN